MGISCAVCDEKRKGGSRVWAGRELINPYPMYTRIEGNYTCTTPIGS